jgi:hypothetical protein
MNLLKLHELVKSLVEINARGYSGKSLEELEIVIPVKRVGTIGGRSCVIIESIDLGFDWDSGKIFMNPEKELREIDINEFEQMKKSCEKFGWDMYENRNLKSEIVNLKRKIKELENDNK